MTTLVRMALLLALALPLPAMANGPRGMVDLADGSRCETFMRHGGGPRAAAFRLQIGPNWPRGWWLGLTCLGQPHPDTPYTGAMTGWLTDRAGRIPCRWHGKWYRTYGRYGPLLSLIGTSTCRPSGTSQESDVVLQPDDPVVPRRWSER